MSLKREVNSLKIENDHLKSLTVFQRSPNTAGSFHFGDDTTNGSLSNHERSNAITAPKVDIERLAELENNELSELVKLYMTENHDLRRENNELFVARDSLLRDQEVVCRENERLLKKLEDVNLVCCRSPLIPARPTLSGDIFNFSTGSENDFGNGSNIWKNPLNSSSENIDGRISTADSKVSFSLQKEIDKMRISNSIDAVANNHKQGNMRIVE